MDIAAWLRSLGLERYEQAFRDHAIEPDLLPSLTADDLKELGVTAVGHRRRLLDAVAALASERQGEIPRPNLAEAEGERRQVTVLFADLTGFTALSRELDPEELHSVLGRYFQQVDQIVVEYGGHIDKHVGDCVMAVFGAPIAHGNDAERAVRAALAIREAMPALSAAVGRELTGHIGIAGGQVVASATGSASHREYTVTGDTVNLASRLAGAARPGEVLISDPVRHALAGRIDCADRGALAVKGFAEPVPAWSLTGFGRTAERRHFVGRRSELDQFRALLAACRETKRGQTLYIRGEPGIGKTRLVAEFQRTAREAGFACHSGLVLDFGARTGRDAIRSLMRSLVGLDGDSDAAVAAAYASIDEADAVFLNDLLDLPQSAAQRALYDAMDHATRRSGRRRLITQLLANASRLQPRLLAVDDLQWADQITLGDLAGVAASITEYPAVLVITSRIEGDPLDRAWRIESAWAPLATIDLGPLHVGEARLLAADFLAAAGDLATRCIERAAGNPLFLEQLLHHAGEAEKSAVPGSVQSLVQARLDRISTRERSAVQAASVLGQLFERSALAHLLDDEEPAVDQLVAHLLVRPQGDGFMFHHALIRDAIYDGILKSRRRELHRRAAGWYAERDLLLHAEHLDRAHDPTAARAYADAARSEAASYHYDTARRLAVRGLEITTTPSDRFTLERLSGEILYELGDMQHARAAYEGALATAESGPERCRAFTGLATVKRMTDDLTGAATDLDSAAAIAGAAGLVLEQARIHYLRGNLCFPRGDVVGCIREHSKSLVLAREAGAPELEAQALGGLGDGEYLRGRMMSAHRAFSECLALCQQHGFGRIEVANRPMRAIAAFFVGETRAAAAEASASVDAAAKVGHQRAQMISHHGAYFAFHHLAEWAHALEHIEPALVLAQQLGARRFEAEALACRAELHRIAGRQTEALADIEAALAISRETGMAFLGTFMLGILAHTTNDRTVFDAALAEGDALLDAGAVGHNHYLFHRDAIDACLERELWDQALHHAARLEEFAALEASPLTRFVVARARLLAQVGRGMREPNAAALVQQLHEEGERLGCRYALPAIDAVLA